MSAPAGAWIHVNWQGQNEPPVLGPFTGNGAVQLAAAGLHLYPTEAAAAAAPAQAITVAQGDTILQEVLSGPGIGSGFGLGQNIGQAFDNAKKAVTSLNPLGALFQANIWIRVGEVLLGLVLLAVGLARITHAVPIATKVATTAGAVGLA